MTYQMKRSENNGKDFDPCPTGMQQMVLADILDLGWSEVVYKGKSKGLQPKIKLVWQSIKADGEFGRFLLFDFPMTLSFGSKSALYRRLAAWLGEGVIESMLEKGEAFDSLIGRNALVNVEHKPSEQGDRIFANISSITPLMEGMTEIKVEGYERACERENWDDRKPNPSAFDMHFVPPTVSPDSNSARAAALPSVAPAAQDTAPMPNTVTPPAPVFEPISGKLTVDLFKMGQNLFGAAADQMLDAQALELTRNERKLSELSNDEGIQLKDKLRAFPPAKAMEIKAGADKVPDADDDSIFDGE